MVSCKSILAAGIVLASAALAPLAAAATGPTAAAGPIDGRARAAARTSAATSGSELWATVDICNAPRHPYTVGIRGSMPGDGHAHDTMYMRFLVQSLDVSTKQWSDIGKSADSGFVQVGSGASARQAGRSFEFKPTSTAYTLRGLVEFQWHRAGHTVRVVTEPTTGGHTSLAGAEPKGFSAPTCTLQ